MHNRTASLLESQDVTTEPEAHLAPLVTMIFAFMPVYCASLANQSRRRMKHIKCIMPTRSNFPNSFYFGDQILLVLSAIDIQLPK